MVNGKNVLNWIPILAVIVALLGINGIFAGWYSNALDNLSISVSADISEIKNTFRSELVDIQSQINNRFRISNEATDVKVGRAVTKCDESVARFFRAAEKNGEKLDKVSDNINSMRVTMQDFRTKQEMVLDRVDLSNDGRNPR